MQRLDVPTLLRARRPLIGMVHLRALPGAPQHRSMADVLDAARADAVLLARGGIDAILVENYGDTPFHPGAVPPETVAGLTAAVAAVAREVDVPLGVNVLRNDAAAALGVAAATGAAFIRVNVHTGGMFTDQGWITGRAHETVRLRAALRADVAILADVLVKHATAPAGTDLGDAARDAWERGAADALVVSGTATGQPASLDRLRTVRDAVPGAPLLVGSGLTTASAAAVAGLAAGAIVGSAFQRGGRAGAGVEPDRVHALVEAWRAATA